MWHKYNMCATSVGSEVHKDDDEYLKQHSRKLTVEVRFDEDAEIDHDDEGADRDYPVTVTSVGNDGADAKDALDHFHSTVPLACMDYCQIRVLDIETGNEICEGE